MVISIWAFGKHLLKNEQSKSVTLRKTIDSLVANTKIWAFKQNQNFWKICIHQFKLDSLPILNLLIISWWY